MDHAAIDEMTPEELNEIPPEELKAYLSGGAAPAAEAEPAAPAAPQAEAATDPAQGEQTATSQPTAQGQQQMVPYGALHEERTRRQALEQQVAQHQAALQNPDLLRHLAAQYQPPEQADFMSDPEKYVQQVAQQTAVPLMQHIQQLQSVIQQQQQGARLQALTQQFPDFQQTVAQFDAAMPHMANADPEQKYLMVKGAQASNPAYMQQQIQAAAQKLAEQQVAAALGGIKATAPVTLAGATPSKANDAPTSPDALNDDEWDKLPDAQRRKMLGG